MNTGTHTTYTQSTIGSYYSFCLIVCVVVVRMRSNVAAIVESLNIKWHSDDDKILSRALLD